MQIFFFKVCINRYSYVLANGEVLGLFSSFLVKYLLSIIQDLPLALVEDVIDVGIGSWGS